MINIGITIHLKENENIWNNGITQNVINLYLLLKNSKKYNVYILNTSKNNNFDYNIEGIKIIPIDDKIQIIDLLLITGSQISDKCYFLLKNKGVKIVYYNCGASYILDMEEILFNPETKKKLYSHKPDEIWIIPQNYKTNKHYFETLYGVPVKEVPFIWSSTFIDYITKTYKIDCKYKPSNNPKRISSFEPNINVVKFAMYNILITEQVYRKNPNLIKHVYVTNTDKIKKNPLFINIMNQLSIVKEKIATFESRYRTPFFLNKYTDVVISHQWENPLNYAYLDALYLNYPLVHNAHMIKNAGYYYPEFDVEKGKEQLLFALSEHDNNIEEYNEKTQKILKKYLPTNKKSIKKYDKLIYDLFEPIDEIKDGISIIMAYHNRRNLLIKTLHSINKSDFDKNKLQIIIVNDNSLPEHSIDDLSNLFNDMDIKIINIENNIKDWNNSCIPYNIGFNHIKYDKVIIQNPETYHNGDILTYTYNNINDKNYISYACYSLNWENTRKEKYDDVNIVNIANKIPIGDGWYNHSTHKPTYYHFCSALTYNNLCKLNGFDERYKNGSGFDDNEIIERVKNLKLDLKIVDSPFVFHQAHNSPYRYFDSAPEEEKKKKRGLFEINKNIFYNITKKENKYIVENNKYFNK